MISTLAIILPFSLEFPTTTLLSRGKFGKFFLLHIDTRTVAVVVYKKKENRMNEAKTAWGPNR